MKRKKLKMIMLTISALVLISAVIAAVKLYPDNNVPQTSSASEQTSSFEEQQYSVPSQNIMPETKSSYVIENVEHICQLNKWPNGCESVSAVMALNFVGIDVSVDYFIDNYLEMSEVPFDPYKTYGGNPRDGSGFGCYAPVIKSALDKALAGSDYAADIVSSATVESLCEKYIQNDIPVIFWATQDMQKPFEGKSWEYEGESITWIRPEHCLLLIGYTEDSYVFCDPLKTESSTSYPKVSVETAYEGLHSQAVVIMPKTDYSKS